MHVITYVFLIITNAFNKRESCELRNNITDLTLRSI